MLYIDRTIFNFLKDRMIDSEESRWQRNRTGRGDHFLSYKFIERTIER